jgi:hypothetical protein
MDTDDDNDALCSRRGRELTVVRESDRIGIRTWSPAEFSSELVCDKTVGKWFRHEGLFGSLFGAIFGFESKGAMEVI